MKNIFQTPSEPGVLLKKNIFHTPDEAKSVGLATACVPSKIYSVIEKLNSRYHIIYHNSKILNIKSLNFEI